jgi:hypothetical protein
VKRADREQLRRQIDAVRKGPDNTPAAIEERDRIIDQLMAMTGPDETDREPVSLSARRQMFNALDALSEAGVLFDSEIGLGTIVTAVFPADRAIAAGRGAA